MMQVAKDNNKLRRHSQLLQLQTAGMTAEHGNNTDNTDGDDASVKLDDVADSMRIYYEEEVASETFVFQLWGGDTVLLGGRNGNGCCGDYSIGGQGRYNPASFLSGDCCGCLSKQG